MVFEIFFKHNIEKVDREIFEKEINNLISDKLFINHLFQKHNGKFEKIVFSVGGDGTFLSAVNKFKFDNILYIPINNGTLGFYTSWDRNSLLTKNFINTHINELPLLKVSLKDKSYLCINEATLISPTQTQILDLYINDLKFESFRGTGICISTPSGSTAYNKSLQGSLFNPSNKLFQLTKIAPINNNKYRTISNSLIFNEFDTVTIKFLENTNTNSIITIDRENHSIIDEQLTFSLSSQKLSILSTDYDFWKRIKNNFLVDIN